MPWDSSWKKTEEKKRHATDTRSADVFLLLWFLAATVAGGGGGGRRRGQTGRRRAGGRCVSVRGCVTGTRGIAVGDAATNLRQRERGDSSRKLNCKDAITRDTPYEVHTDARTLDASARGSHRSTPREIRASASAIEVVTRLFPLWRACLNSLLRVSCTAFSARGGQGFARACAVWAHGACQRHTPPRRL